MPLPNERSEKNQNQKWKICLVDDHPIVRQALAQLISSTGTYIVCGEAGNPAEALQVVDKSKPDLVVVDLSLGGRSGFDLIEDLRRYHRDVPLLVLSMYEEAGYIERALRMGARGYVTKKEATERILDALDLILKGGVYVSDEIKDRLLMRMVRDTKATPQPIEVLSNRELEVLELIGQGHKPRSVAERLNLSTKTVETHVEHIKQKLSLENANELSVFATGWVRESLT